jgi:hypothetical protein
MKAHVFSYRFAKEIIEHPDFGQALHEVMTTINEAPVFVYAGKSRKNVRLDVVQQLVNTYFDRRLGIDFGWQYHPLATRIKDSGLKADFRKSFGSLAIQAEVQLGNMARWYSDIFKFQTAYAQGLIQFGLSIVPMFALAKRIDSNIVNFERAQRELPSADLSITLPILLVGLDVDDGTPVVDVRQCRFGALKQIIGKGHEENRWRIVHGFLTGADIHSIGMPSETGPMLEPAQDDEGDE